MGRILYLELCAYCHIFEKAVGVKEETMPTNEMDNHVPTGFSTNMYSTHGGGWAENDWQ